MLTMPVPVRPADAFDRALALLDEARDLLAERVLSPEPPSWCRARGWHAFLDSLDDGELGRCEGLGLHAAIDALVRAPPSLRSLAERVKEVVALPRPDLDAVPTVLHRATSRKRGQVAALAVLCRERVRHARRVVDFGAGHGHLTRTLAESLGIDALGVDRDPERVATARTLTEGSRARFEVYDVAAGSPPMTSQDFLVGLHACGGLGDALVRAAAETGAPALLVSCCLQKRPEAARLPLSERGRAAGFVLSRELLGLTNLASRYDGVEQGVEGILRDRETRWALYLLLRGRGLAVRVGEEVHGINRKRVRRGLAALAPEVLARRGLPPPSDDELAEVAARARHEHGRIRRLSLPRNMLGRVPEIAVALDRVCAFEDRGRRAHLFEGFDPGLSPRNLTLLAEA